MDDRLKEYNKLFGMDIFHSNKKQNTDTSQNPQKDQPFSITVNNNDSSQNQKNFIENNFQNPDQGEGRVSDNQRSHGVKRPSLFKNRRAQTEANLNRPEQVRRPTDPSGIIIEDSDYSQDQQQNNYIQKDHNQTKEITGFGSLHATDYVFRKGKSVISRKPSTNTGRPAVYSLKPEERPKSFSAVDPFHSFPHAPLSNRHYTNKLARPISRNSRDERSSQNKSKQERSFWDKNRDFKRASQTKRRETEQPNYKNKSGIEKIDRSVTEIRKTTRSVLSRFIEEERGSRENSIGRSVDGLGSRSRSRTRTESATVTQDYPNLSKFMGSERNRMENFSFDQKFVDVKEAVYRNKTHGQMVSGTFNNSNEPVNHHIKVNNRDVFINVDNEIDVDHRDNSIHIKINNIKKGREERERILVESKDEFVRNKTFQNKMRDKKDDNSLVDTVLLREEEVAVDEFAQTIDNLAIGVKKEIVVNEVNIPEKIKPIKEGIHPDEWDNRLDGYKHTMIDTQRTYTERSHSDMKKTEVTYIEGTETNNTPIDRTQTEQDTAIIYSQEDDDKNGVTKIREEPFHKEKPVNKSYKDKSNSFREEKRKPENAENNNPSDPQMENYFDMLDNSGGYKPSLRNAKRPIKLMTEEDLNYSKQRNPEEEKIKEEPGFNQIENNNQRKKVPSKKKSSRSPTKVSEKFHYPEGKRSGRLDDGKKKELEDFKKLDFTKERKKRKIDKKSKKLKPIKKDFEDEFLPDRNLVDFNDRVSGLADDEFELIEKTIKQKKPKKKLKKIEKKSPKTKTKKKSTSKTKKKKPEENIFDNTEKIEIEPKKNKRGKAKTAVINPKDSKNNKRDKAKTTTNNLKNPKNTTGKSFSMIKSKSLQNLSFGKSKTAVIENNDLNEEEFEIKELDLINTNKKKNLAYTQILNTVYKHLSKENLLDKIECFILDDKNQEIVVLLNSSKLTATSNNLNNKNSLKLLTRKFKYSATEETKEQKRSKSTRNIRLKEEETNRVSVYSVLIGRSVTGKSLTRDLYVKEVDNKLSSGHIYCLKSRLIR